METLNYVDLGLESGTLWATCNVGATKPEEYGDYFAWSETSPKKKYDCTYKHGSAYNALTKYCNNSDYGKDGFTDGKMVLDAEDDAATANWGSEWRMPTKEEFIELITKCRWKQATLNGKKGYLVTGYNGNSIFLPAAGCYFQKYLINVGKLGLYWSSTPSDDYSFQASFLSFGFGKTKTDCYHNIRFIRHSVRPVRNLKSISK